MLEEGKADVLVPSSGGQRTIGAVRSKSGVPVNSPSFL